MRSIEFDRGLVQVIPVLRARARSMTRNGVDDEDLLQSTLERALLYSELFERGSDLRRWLFTIMRHRHADHCRALARAQTHSRESQRRELCHHQALTTRPVWQELETADIRALLCAVPEPLRTTFDLACLRRFSYTEVAHRLDIPVATVGTRVMRARSLLRVLIERRCSSSTTATDST